MITSTIRAALLTSALLIGTATTAAATAVPTIPAKSDVTCIVSTIPPSKSGLGSMAPIAFGFKVHCFGGEPDLRNIVTKLWRYDFDREKEYEQAGRLDQSTKVDAEVIYFASCSDAGIFYDFRTEVIMTAFHGEWDRTSGESSKVRLQC